jgi:hypothetical protein
MRPRHVRLLACAAALTVFCVVQDRVTATGARQYVALQRDAFAGRGEPVTIDAILRPAVARSVTLASLSSGAVLAAGLGAASLLGRGRR